MKRYMIVIVCFLELTADAVKRERNRVNFKRLGKSKLSKTERFVYIQGENGERGPEGPRGSPGTDGRPVSTRGRRDTPIKVIRNFTFLVMSCSV